MNDRSDVSHDPDDAPDVEDARPLDAFVALLDRCKAQVAADPAGYRDNPHLYALLHRIYLRLCHGNIPDHALPGHATRSRR